MSQSELITIYPSDIANARELAKKRNPNDKNGYGAFRINFGVKSVNKAGNTTYINFEIFLDEQRKWQPVSLYFQNMKHVGKISPLEERAKAQVQDIALLFKADYTYKRTVTGADGKKKEVVEEYGKEKDFICKAMMAHVKKHQDKGEYFPKTHTVIPNVKHERDVKEKDGKIRKEVIEPANINVQISFAGAAGEVSETTKKAKTTKFKTLILDASRPIPLDQLKQKGDWQFEAAKARFNVKQDDGTTKEVSEDLNNGNIHLFLKGGSLITGWDNMSAVVISTGKISLPSKLDVCIVKQATMARVTAGNLNADNLAAITGAAVPEEQPSNPGVVMSSQATEDIHQAIAAVSADEFGSAPADDLTAGAPVDDLGDF